MEMRSKDVYAKNRKHLSLYAQVTWSKFEEMAYVVGRQDRTSLSLSAFALYS